MTRSRRSPLVWLFSAILAIAFVAALLVLPAPVNAAETVGSVALVMAASTAPADVPFWQSILTGENIAWLLALVGSIVSIYKHQDLTTSQKALRAVIVGVEQATQLPAVQAEAKKIKQSIQTYAVSHGIQNELDELVQHITDQLPPTPTASTKKEIVG